MTNDIENMEALDFAELTEKVHETLDEIIAENEGERLISQVEQVKLMLYVLTIAMLKAERTRVEKQE